MKSYYYDYDVASGVMMCHESDCQNDDLTVAYMAGSASRNDEVRNLRAELAASRAECERLRELYRSERRDMLIIIPGENKNCWDYETEDNLREAAAGGEGKHNG